MNLTKKLLSDIDNRKDGKVEIVNVTVITEKLKDLTGKSSLKI